MNPARRLATVPAPPGSRPRATFGDRCDLVAAQLRGEAEAARALAAEAFGRGAPGRRDVHLLRAVELEGMLAQVEAMRAVDAHMRGMR